MRESLAGLLALAGLALLGFHTYEWARHGIWATYRVTHLFHWLGAEAWASNPQDWLGVHGVLQWCPLWALCLLCSYVVLVFED